VHQIKQRKIESLEQELYDLEARWREICQELSNGNKELEEMVEEGEERIKATEDARKGVYWTRLYPGTHADPLQPPSLTLNSWRMLRASAHFLLPLQTFQT
jgi:hypothetical protein